MITKKLIFVIVILILFSSAGQLQGKFAGKIIKKIVNDYKTFYSPNNLWKLSLGIGYAGIYANTSFDIEIQNFCFDYIKSRTTDDISKAAKTFGEGRITVPIYLTAALLGYLDKNSKIGSVIGEWGRNTSRALLVGAPPVLLFQIALGASRPEEGRSSRWRPFEDNNAVSGHSFMGAVPFLTAAKMTDKRCIKYFFNGISTFTGLSRINDNKHYFSQAILGWWIAYLSVNSIKSEKYALVPLDKGIGLMIYF